MEINKSITKWLGLGLIVFALLFIPMLAVVPFLPLNVGQKAVLTTVLIAGGQVLTWIGVALLGKELVQRYRQYLNPKNWFRKKK